MSDIVSFLSESFETLPYINQRFLVEF